MFSSSRLLRIWNFLSSSLESLLQDCLNIPRLPEYSAQRWLAMLQTSSATVSHVSWTDQCCWDSNYKPGWFMNVPQYLLVKGFKRIFPIYTCNLQYAPLGVFKDHRRDWRKALSSGPALRDPSFRNTSAEGLLACTPQTPAPYLRHPITVAAPSSSRMSKGPMMIHSFWTLVRATVARA